MNQLYSINFSSLCGNLKTYSCFLSKCCFHHCPSTLNERNNAARERNNGIVLKHSYVL